MKFTITLKNEGDAFYTKTVEFGTTARAIDLARAKATDALAKITDAITNAGLGKPEFSVTIQYTYGRSTVIETIQ